MTLNPFSCRDSRRSLSESSDGQSDGRGCASSRLGDRGRRLAARLGRVGGRRCSCRRSRGVNLGVYRCAGRRNSARGSGGGGAGLGRGAVLDLHVVHGYDRTQLGLLDVRGQIPALASPGSLLGRVGGSLEVARLSPNKLHVAVRSVASLWAVNRSLNITDERDAELHRSAHV